MPNVPGSIANAVVAFIAANPDKVKGLLSTGEAAVSLAAKNTLNHLPRPGGVLGYIFPSLIAEGDAEIDALVNKFGPDELYALVLAEAKLLARDLGG